MNLKEILLKIDKNLEKMSLERDTWKRKSEDQGKEIDSLRKMISELEAKHTSLTNDELNQSNLSNTSSNEGVKLKIDGLINEIDECLALLNN